MPRGDGTGPMGMGAMTGRAAGLCAGYAVPGYANSLAGRGFAMGFGRGMGMACGRGRGFAGRGFGWRSMAYAAPYGTAAQFQAPDPELEKQILMNQAKAVESELESIKKRLSELESAKSS